MIKPDAGYISYIVNPKSGASSSKVLAGQFREFLKEKGFEVRVSITKSMQHVRQLAEEAAENEQCAMLVACGGDGTIREAAEGMHGIDKPMMIVPGGTENLIANELGFDRNVQHLKDAFENGRLIKLDLGKANGRIFTSVVGCGFDAEVVSRVSSKRLGHINYLDYFWPLWRIFWSYDFPKLKVTADGKEIFNDKGLVIIGNISRYALGLKILNSADCGDAKLDVCAYRCSSRTRLIGHSVATVAKKHVSFDDVCYAQAKEIKVSSDSEKVPTQIDGDPGPDLPVEIEIIPSAANILVPEHFKPAGIRARIKQAIR